MSRPPAICGGDRPPVTGAELLNWTKWELVQLIKLLAADQTPTNMRKIVDQLREQLDAREQHLHQQGKRKAPHVPAR